MAPSFSSGFCCGWPAVDAAVVEDEDDPAEPEPGVAQDDEGERQNGENEQYEHADDDGQRRSDDQQQGDTAEDPEHHPADVTETGGPRLHGPPGELRS